MRWLFQRSSDLRGEAPRLFPDQIPEPAQLVEVQLHSELPLGVSSLECLRAQLRRPVEEAYFGCLCLRPRPFSRGRDLRGGLDPVATGNLKASLSGSGSVHHYALVTSQKS